MNPRLTDRARRVLKRANDEANRLHNSAIEPEHIVLGLFAEGQGVAANVLHNLEIDRTYARVDADVQRLAAEGSSDENARRLPQSPNAARVIECAIEESEKLRHNYLGTEHLLMGLLRVEDGIAAQVLSERGLTLDRVRDEVVKLLAHGQWQQPMRTVPTEAARPTIVQRLVCWLRGRFEYRVA